MSVACDVECLGRLRSCVVALTFLLSCSVFALAAETAAGKPEKKVVRIMAIGNSFTLDATKYLKDIVKASGGNKELVLIQAMRGGTSLAYHCKAAAAFEADPKDPKGRAYGNSEYIGPRRMNSLKEKLLKGKWDYVTIQQVSNHSWRIDTYRPHAQTLCDYIEKYAPKAQIVFHETWAYRADFGLDPDKLYAGLHRAYYTIAKEVRIRKIIPVGSAFHKAYSHPRWQFKYPDPKFDYENPVYPNLPDQTHSLNKGWFWRKSKDKMELLKDATHANTAGQYLGAAVWFEYFFSKSVVGNAFVPNGLAKKDVAFLQRTAHETVAEAREEQKSLQKVETPGGRPTN